MSFLVLLFCFVGNYVEYELLWVVVERLEDGVVLYSRVLTFLKDRDFVTHAATLFVRQSCHIDDQRLKRIIPLQVAGTFAIHFERPVAREGRLLGGQLQ